MSPSEYLTLLKTKISIPPPRHKLVSRARLVSRLAESVAGPLTLIAATAGSGKTTVLTDWIHASGGHVRFAWLSLDKDDNDPVRFVSYVIAALEIVEPGIGRAALSMLGSLKMPAHAAVPSISGHDTANRQHDHVDAVERSAPP